MYRVSAYTYGYADLSMVLGWELLGFDIIELCAKIWGCGSFIYGVLCVMVMPIICFGGALVWLNFKSKCRVLGLYYALRLCRLPVLVGYGFMG